MHRSVALLLFLLSPFAALAQELVFASAEDASRLLAAPDAFTRRLSPFDRASRLRTNQPVSDAEFRAFVAGEARNWSDSDRRRVTAAYDSLRPELARLNVPVPAKLLLIQTSGREEGEAAYTRGDAIILPGPKLFASEAMLKQLLAHELFHVVSRANPELRDRLYRVVGFEPCGEVEHPAALRARRITNPDAPVNAHAIEVDVAGTKAWGVPILYSSAAEFDPTGGKTFFSYLTFELLLIERTGEGGHRLLAGPEGQPRLVPIDKAGGYAERIGRNTGYVIHPEEIVADNFMLLVTGTAGAKSPGILDRLRAEFMR